MHTANLMQFASRAPHCESTATALQYPCCEEVVTAGMAHLTADDVAKGSGAYCRMLCRTIKYCVGLPQLSRSADDGRSVVADNPGGGQPCSALPSVRPSIRNLRPRSTPHIHRHTACRGHEHSRARQPQPVPRSIGQRNFDVSALRTRLCTSCVCALLFTPLPIAIRGCAPPLICTHTL